MATQSSANMTGRQISGFLGLGLLVIGLLAYRTVFPAPAPPPKRPIIASGTGTLSGGSRFVWSRQGDTLGVTFDPAIMPVTRFASVAQVITTAFKVPVLTDVKQADADTWVMADPNGRAYLVRYTTIDGGLVRSVTVAR